MLSLLHMHHSYWVVTGLTSLPTTDLPAAINLLLEVNSKSPALDPSKTACIINNSSRWGGRKAR